MDGTTLQIPVSKSLKSDATLVAKEYGFSSLQEIVRVLLTKLAHRQLAIQIEEIAYPLSRRAEKRYLKMEEDFRQGKNVYTAKNLNELMRELRK